MNFVPNNYFLIFPTVLFNVLYNPAWPQTCLLFLHTLYFLVCQSTNAVLCLKCLHSFLFVYQKAYSFSKVKSNFLPPLKTFLSWKLSLFWAVGLLYMPSLRSFTSPPCVFAICFTYLTASVWLTSLLTTLQYSHGSVFFF